MVSLSDALQEPKKAKSGVPCTVGSLLNDLDVADRKALLVALGDKNVQGTWIARQISETVGVPMRGTSIQRHRRGDCLCS